eukprot:TRINITY_DN72779_c0_g1_i1.p1 TRINITY_DN72779_c0_g1~~TRINITY_DN72779_c0_g1_i1.p1  ORF type:complete len:669 (-),score=97.88 TRINITY_DN72779_c0_g1_i1:264-2270(-)
MQRVLAAFEQFDTSRSGKVTQDVFRDMFKSLGFQDEEVEVLLDKLPGRLADDSYDYRLSLRSIFKRGTERFAALVGEGAGCSIPQTELRGITLPQLHTALSCATALCMEELWTSTRPEDKDLPLSHETINLYDLVHYLVKPATASRKCSHVELVASGMQTPVWFVSHWWGEAVANFIACLKQHSKDRGLDEHSPYWVCAYANNQHAIDAELGVTVEETPFFRALQIAHGTVSILDAEAVVFTRAWCGYELYISVIARGSDFLHDIYTAVKSNSMLSAVGLVDGFAVADAGFIDSRPDPRSKAMREARFPAHFQQAALQFHVTEAKASVQSDLDMILRTITDPCALDATVASKVCAAQLGQMMLSSEVIEAELFERELEALQKSRLRKLVVSLPSYLPAATSADRLSQVCGALPTTLEDIRFEKTGKGATAGVAALLARSTVLASIRLQGCRIDDSDVAVLASSILTNLTLGAQVPDTNTLSGSLTSLNLNLNSIGDIGAKMLAVSLSSNASLTSLDLGNNAIGDEGAEALAQSKALRHLDVGNNGRITARGTKALVDGLSECLVKLSLSGNKLLDEGAVAVGSALKHGSVLTELDLSFNDIGATGLAHLSASLRTSCLKRLRLEGHLADATSQDEIEEAWTALHGSIKGLTVSSRLFVNEALAGFLVR